MRAYTLTITITIAIATAVHAQPMQNRLMLAISDDGLRFTKLLQTVFNEGDVPDAVVTPDGTVFLYFQGNLPPNHDQIVVGISSDGKNNWSFQPVSIMGIGGWKVRPCDPDVIYRDGLFRLYMTGDPVNDKIPETYSATSTDGIHFTLEQDPRFSGGTRAALDPSLLWIGDTLHYFAGGGAIDRNWHAVSTDGLTFTAVPEFTVNGMMMSNGIAVPGGYRFYGFTNRPPRDIRSIFSSDGVAWQQDAGPRLEVERNDTLESDYVKDPAIVLRNGSYLMYYVTRKPEFTSVQNEMDAAVDCLRLGAIYPHPVAGAATVTVEARTAGPLRVEMVDALGRRAALLFDDTIAPGEYSFVWDGGGLSAGVYRCVLTRGARVVSRPVIVR